MAILEAVIHYVKQFNCENWIKISYNAANNDFMVLKMLVLGIESSCDETGVAVYHETRGILSHALHSQVLAHQQYGGVVPELASRDHVKWIVNLVDKALIEANISRQDIDAIAYTAGPGLIGALLVGASFAKSLSMALNIPAIGIHHLEAHILAAILEKPDISFPFLALLVSGGHTELIAVKALGAYEILGQTLDDAVGEAFDKTAKLMGIPYPGGAELARLADGTTLDKSFAPFPRPMTDRPGLDFSFSGLKTHALNAWHKSDKTIEAKQQIAAHFQAAIIDTLLIKCRRAVEATGIKRLVVAGGVGANISLRQALTQWMQSINGEVYFPKHEYCTDNGAMVAYAGYLRLARGEKDAALAIKVQPRWVLG